MPSFFKAISKIKKRGSPLHRHRKRAKSSEGTIECVCKKSKSPYTDITIGGKLLTSKDKDSPVNHVRLKRAKGMNEGVWALSGGVVNPCKCSVVSGAWTKSGVPKKKRALKGINMVGIKWR
jgi:hypothetical protein